MKGRAIRVPRAGKPTLYSIATCRAIRTASPDILAPCVRCGDDRLEAARASGVVAKGEQHAAKLGDIHSHVTTVASWEEPHHCAEQPADQRHYFEPSHPDTTDNFCLQGVSA